VAKIIYMGIIEGNFGDDKNGMVERGGGQLRIG
jgi:hypothetical protein